MIIGDFFFWEGGLVGIKRSFVVGARLLELGPLGWSFAIRLKSKAWFIFILEKSKQDLSLLFANFRCQQHKITFFLSFLYLLFLHPIIYYILTIK